MEGMDLLRSRRGLMAKVAQELGITRAAVVGWKRVPDTRLADVARITGIAASVLRPDLADALRPTASAADAIGEKVA